MFSFFIARRFYRSSSSKKGKASMPAVHIATAGVAVGLAVMILSVCLVKGFQGEVAAKLAGFASHIEVLDLNSQTDADNHPITADAALMDVVKKTTQAETVQRVSVKIGVMKTHDDFSGIMLKGIGKEYDKKFIRSCMVEGKFPDFGNNADAINQIVLSRQIAEMLHLKVGDKVYVYFFTNTIKQRRFEIAGIYETHLQQFDKNFVWTDLQTINQLNDWGEEQCSLLEVKLQNFDDLEERTAKLGDAVTAYKHTHQITNLSVMSIRDNPRTRPVLSWLELLDLNVMVILVIMLCVAGVTMISGLLILILERTTTIGVLKALGASNRRIRRIFLVYAGHILVRGMVIGNVFAFLLALLQSQFHLVRLDPATYYVDAVPLAYDPVWLIGINLATLLITLLTLVLPAFIVSVVQPAKTIRFD
ncbi:MAG: FtsX-like permease family protein [Alloprevotella sp.]|nr:FtsX-like permease family protein [Alloprevotella sp.]